MSTTSAVSARDGVKNGFLLSGYVLGVAILRGIITGIGIGIFNSRSGGLYTSSDPAMMLVGGITTLVGGVAMYAGLFGASYKIVADGVKPGIGSADRDIRIGEADSTRRAPVFAVPSFRTPSGHLKALLRGDEQPHCTTCARLMMLLAAQDYSGRGA